MNNVQVWDVTVSDEFKQVISICSLQDGLSALKVITLDATSGQTRYLAGISSLCEGDHHRAITDVMILVPSHTLMLIGMPADLLHTSKEQTLLILLE